MHAAIAFLLFATGVAGTVFFWGYFSVTITQDLVEEYRERQLRQRVR
jgi:hypothetical protein